MHPLTERSAVPGALSPLELAHRLAQPADGPLVVDVRPRRQFACGHIPASQTIPAGLLVAGEWPEGDLLPVKASAPEQAWFGRA